MDSTQVQNVQIVATTLQVVIVAVITSVTGLVIAISKFNSQERRRRATDNLRKEVEK